ncbi:Cyclic AMP receptor-like protein A [Ceratocystis lukuohia]|uniref:G-protein coupled receptors family 2 profile 2 domain-containing protein n=2 Tax=Ceratocystis TaxID=5157 RepID=A0A2C5XDQ7_9PEZI|nr:hypothetical protein CFIMG_004993RA [Ceratocystis fimbriata CBS 114723]
MGLSERQLETISSIERAGSALSMVGITLIVASYWAIKRLRTIPNLFILYASLANAGASVACVIGYDGLRSGVNSTLCQAQAFLLEMFMQSDPFWSLAMAINVLLVFFFGASPSSFRNYLWLYCTLCYGIPALPAITLLFVRTKERGKVYGDATLWCWIGPNWAFLRLWTYYVPIWICIITSLLIYFAVGYRVFKQRNQLRHATFSHTEADEKQQSISESHDCSEKGLTRPELTITTEVEVTSVTNFDAIIRQSSSSQARPSAGFSTFPSMPSMTPAVTPARRSGEWCPSEESLEPQTIPCPNAHLETTCSSTSANKAFRESQLKRSLCGQCREKLRRIDPVKLAYLRTSFIFAISVLVTWTPSSVNRIHNLMYPSSVDFGLSVASAAVLPLQGLWNAIIFFTTSWRAFREEVLHRLRERHMSKQAALEQAQSQHREALRQYHFRSMPARNGSPVWDDVDNAARELAPRGPYNATTM